MILKTDTHEFTCTSCRRTGRPCFEALQLAKALAESVLFAGPLLNPDFELSGFTLLEQCGYPCPAPFRVTKTEVRVFCDVDADDAFVAFAEPVQVPKAAIGCRDSRQRLLNSERALAALILARPREQQTRPPRSRVHRLSRIFTIVSDRIRRFGFVQSHPKKRRDNLFRRLITKTTFA
jgi:hypothetical protein